LGYQGDDLLSKDLSDLIVRRTADLNYFSERYFGEMVVRQTVLSGSTPDEIETFAKNRDMDLNGTFTRVSTKDKGLDH
jgi:hypothetical protein